MKENKLILVLVEGKSDQTALSLIEKFCENNKVQIYITKGDITSDFKTTYSNCENVLKDFIKKFINEYGLEKKDILQVIHIIDTDGAFIPDSNIILNNNADSTLYYLDHIETNNVKKIIDRNNKKISIISKLCSISKIYKIDYKIFYMSCNLDHVIHNEINIADASDKVKKAFEFREKFLDDKQGFINFFNSSSFTVKRNYEDSWEFIKQGLNSLNRYSNVFLFIDEILSS